MNKIAIQGGFGAFHEMAAKHYFENETVEILPRDTFKDVISSLREKHADYGIMAIENTVAGSILANYKLMQQSNKKIIGEIYLRIRQNLVALPGQKIEDIKEVYSHPMAILQCEVFFEKYPHIKLIESIDTALSAKEISEKKTLGVGAIASQIAAEMYNLEILAASIETNKMNYTRFLILKLDDKNGNGVKKEEINKSSIHFALAHQIGSLSKILSLFSFYDINLSKIQSMPIIGKEWEYQFYVDLEFDNYDRYKQSMEAIKPFTSQISILGEYKKGKSIV
jgi:prephenate dehydratase